MSITRMIIDADTGIDDALAILYAVRSPRIRLEGITACFGNIGTVQAAENTLRLLELAQPGHSIPVAVGAHKPLVRPLGEYSVHVHGANGIGGVELPPAPQRPIDEPGPEFLVRMANENPGELTLVTMGRLTNLALALELDPSIKDKLKSVVVMGGTVFAPGNVTPVAEANLWGDPEAADKVFTSGLPVVMVGLDVTLKTRITREHLELLERVAGEKQQPVVRFMKKTLQHYFEFYRRTNFFIDSAPLHDPLAVLVAVHPELVTYRRMKVRVECESSLSAGMVVADLRAIPRVGSEIEVCTEVQAERAVGQFLSVFE
jgi:inosine-uridine nucleoside N-ribohydrolase